MPWGFNQELPNYNEAFFLLATVAMITVKILPIFIAAIVRETYFFIKIMQPLLKSCNLLVQTIIENGVKQIKITEENLSQSYILCQLLRIKTIVSGSKCIKHFFLFLPLFPLYLSAEWPINVSLKYMPKSSWPINICLKYSMITLTKTLWPLPSYVLNVRSLKWGF